MKKYIKYAFSRTLPVLFGYIFLGIAFGIVLQQAGLILYGLFASVFFFMPAPCSLSLCRCWLQPLRP